MAIFSKPIRLPDLIKAQRRPLVLAALVLLLLRSRLGSLSKESIDVIASKLKGEEATKKLSPEENLKVLQKIYEEDPTDKDAKVLLVPYRDRVTKVPIKPISPEKLENDKSHFPLLPPSAQNKPNIDLSFLKQIRAILLRIVLPPSSWDGKGKSPLWRSKEVGILTLHSAFLVLRTVLSILVARLDGRIVRDLVKADGKGFLRGLGLWFVLAIPSTYTNSMIRHLQSILSLSLRTRLSRYVNDLYLSSYPDLRYYRVASDGASSENDDPNKPPGSALDGVEQYITSDVESWTTAIAGLYGNLLKPSLDMLLFTSQLSRSLGVRGTVLLFLNYYGTVAILRAVTPAFGRLASVEAKLEGEYRRGMGRVGRESEEVAFYNGGYRERDILTKAYMRLIKHVNSIYKIRIAYEWTEDYVIKYLWSAAGYALIAVPILFTRTKRSLGIQTSPGDAAREKAGRDDAVAGRTETYISNRRLLLSLADAGGRMMYAYKDLLELAGLTTRIYTLVSTLHQLPPLETPEISLGQDVSRDADAIILQNVDTVLSQPPIIQSPPVSTTSPQRDDLELSRYHQLQPSDLAHGIYFCLVFVVQPPHEYACPCSHLHPSTRLSGTPLVTFTYGLHHFKSTQGHSETQTTPFRSREFDPLLLHQRSIMLAPGASYHGPLVSFRNALWSISVQDGPSKANLDFGRGTRIVPRVGAYFATDRICDYVELVRVDGVAVITGPKTGPEDYHGWAASSADRMSKGSEEPKSPCSSSHTTSSALLASPHRTFRVAHHNTLLSSTTSSPVVVVVERSAQVSQARDVFSSSFVVVRRRRLDDVAFVGVLHTGSRRGRGAFVAVGVLTVSSSSMASSSCSMGHSPNEAVSRTRLGWDGCSSPFVAVRRGFLEAAVRRQRAAGRVRACSMRRESRRPSCRRCRRNNGTEFGTPDTSRLPETSAGNGEGLGFWFGLAVTQGLLLQVVIAVLGVVGSVRRTPIAVGSSFLSNPGFLNGTSGSRASFFVPRLGNGKIFMRIAVRAVPSKLAPQPPCSGCASVPRWRVVWFRPAFDVGKVQTGGIAKRELAVHALPPKIPLPVARRHNGCIIAGLGCENAEVGRLVERPSTMGAHMHDLRPRCQWPWRVRDLAECALGRRARRVDGRRENHGDGGREGVGKGRPRGGRCARMWRKSDGYSESSLSSALYWAL
ncbi:hypothetical protein D9611_012974 [Ephemerocybe angulata]|uniref:ABC transmembrane type-1 domain-containing protein n=1 Tax=Ephemerocybe angulata TaxID=980116 RepID=A0A8H5C4E9_9AGAR|nr:hypothetical protein D9611_012974 [Tulosesus angulatus]